MSYDCILTESAEIEDFPYHAMEKISSMSFNLMPEKGTKSQSYVHPQRLSGINNPSDSPHKTETLKETRYQGLMQSRLFKLPLSMKS